MVNDMMGQLRIIVGWLLLENREKTADDFTPPTA